MEVILSFIVVNGYYVFKEVYYDICWIFSVYFFLRLLKFLVNINIF